MGFKKKMIDPANPEWTKEDFARARPASEILGKDAAAVLTRKQGRPALDESEKKQPVSIRLSPDVLAALRASGRGWQTRIDDILRTALGLGGFEVVNVSNRPEAGFIAMNLSVPVGMFGKAAPHSGSLIGRIGDRDGLCFFGSVSALDNTSLGFASLAKPENDPTLAADFVKAPLKRRAAKAGARDPGTGEFVSRDQSGTTTSAPRQKK